MASGCNVTYPLVLEWNFMYPLVSELNFTVPLVSEWNFMDPLSQNGNSRTLCCRIKLHIPPVSQWKITHPLSKNGTSQSRSPLSEILSSLLHSLSVKLREPLGLGMKLHVCLRPWLERRVNLRLYWNCMYSSQSQIDFHLKPHVTMHYKQQV
jgi:hypothetical protein